MKKLLLLALVMFACSEPTAAGFGTLVFTESCAGYTWVQVALDGGPFSWLKVDGEAELANIATGAHQVQVYVGPRLYERTVTVRAGERVQVMTVCS